MNQLRLGIVGTGRLGGFHASKAAANREVDFVGVFDVSQESRRKIALQYGVKEYDKLDDLLADVDAVVVAAPSVLHAEIGRRALTAGKHLLVEKPATTESASARELARIAKSKGLVLQVGHVEQHNPAWREAIKRLEDVRSGCVPAFVEATRTSGYTFRSTDVGATLDLMIHDLELVLSLIPSNVERVSAFGCAQLGGWEDEAFATLEFENGSIARLNASRVERRAIRKMTIRTATQTVDVDFASREATLARPKRDVLLGKYSPFAVSYAEMAPRVATFMRDEFEVEELVCEPFDALELEMKNFVDAALRGAPSVAPGVRAAEAVALAEAIVEDLRRRAKRADAQKFRIAG